MKRLSVVAMALGMGCAPASSQEISRVTGATYSACMATADPPTCVVALALSRHDGQHVDVETLIMAGAGVEAGKASLRRPREAVIAAGIAAGQRPDAITPSEAQIILAGLGATSIADSGGLPEDARAAWLWPIALEEEVGNLDLRLNLIQAAHNANRPDIAKRLVEEARIDGPWTPDQRADMASRAARLAGDWRAATRWLNAGGDRATGYSIDGIQDEIDQARLRESYDRAAARRVVDAILANETLLPWPEDGALALRAANARDELANLATRLLRRGRNIRRDAEDRTDDFGLAAWALRGAGDHAGALAAAREGGTLTPTAIAGRGKIGSFGTWPVRELFALSPDEAIATGALWGWDRYQAAIESRRTPDPAWIVGDSVGVALAIPLLQGRNDVGNARALLDALSRLGPSNTPADSDLMMLSAVAEDRSRLDAVFQAALAAMDQGEADLDSALHLVAAYRDARAYLAERAG